MATNTSATSAPPRPLTVNTLAGLQFLAAAAGVVILLGEGTADGELGGGDIGLAIVAALVGALVIGSTTGGGPWSWRGQIVLALATTGYGAATALADDVPGLPVAALGAVWLLLLLLPPSRNWYLRPQPA